jgi:hypothetical protein
MPEVGCGFPKRWDSDRPAPTSMHIRIIQLCTMVPLAGHSSQLVNPLRFSTGPETGLFIGPGLPRFQRPYS